MIHPNAKLNPDTLDVSKLEQKPTRHGFGVGLVEAGKKNEQVVVCCADLAESTRVEEFKKVFPNRYIEIGAAEQNLATIASGLANYGKIPFIASYATFSPGRNNEQIRTTISINNVPVKIVGCHAGVSVGPDGATHQALEDIALMRVQPNMTVLVPCDAEEARKITIAAAEYPHPVYIRLGRSNTPLFTTVETPFEIGKAQIFYTSDAPAVAIIACGTLVHNALLAAEVLLQEGVQVMVVNLPTIKPLDEKTILEVAKKCGAVVTVEEHQIAGGMGSTVAEYLAQNFPVPMQFIGMHDQFGQSGTPDELIKHYGMDVAAIKNAVLKVITLKK